MKEISGDSKIVMGYIYSALFWGVIGLVLGLLISAQMWSVSFNFGEYFSFGRLRTVHTNMLAYGLGITAEMGAFYYIIGRLTKRNLIFPGLAKFQLVFYNFVVLVGMISLFMGYTQSLEYAEGEWYFDLGVVVSWVLFAINVVGTILTRKEKHMYVSLWYILATIVAVAVLYIVNNLHIIAGLGKSYHLFAGLNSANVEWWYGHNAVGFLFTTPILAVFYYFLPKSTGMPIYSHRLSILSFWSLIFMYLWTGAHHLVYTPLPDWLQTLGIVFTILLIAPSWGSVVNGYLTLAPDWSKLRTAYLAKFFIAGITFYGLQTLQGPTQGLLAVSSLIHYTDWVPGHVHMGTMGWVVLTVTAAIYYITSKVYKTEIYSESIANIHFWLVLIGQIGFSITMWITGIRQGLMWKTANADGTLQYSFIETVVGNYPYWMARSAFGVIFIVGMLFFLYNFIMTIVKGKQNLSNQ